MLLLFHSFDKNANEWTGKSRLQNAELSQEFLNMNAWLDYIFLYQEFIKKFTKKTDESFTLREEKKKREQNK